MASAVGSSRCATGPTACPGPGPRRTPGPGRRRRVLVELQEVHTYGLLTSARSRASLRKRRRTSGRRVPAGRSTLIATMEPSARSSCGTPGSPGRSPRAGGSGPAAGRPKAGQDPGEPGVPDRRREGRFRGHFVRDVGDAARSSYSRTWSASTPRRWATSRGGGGWSPDRPRACRLAVARSGLPDRSPGRAGRPRMRAGAL